MSRLADTATNKEFVSETLPPYLIFAMGEKMEPLGHVQDAGRRITWANEARACLQPLDPLRRQIVQRGVAGLARDLTRELTPDHPLDGLLACYAFAGVLAENGHWRSLQDPYAKLALRETKTYVEYGLYNLNASWILSASLRLLARARLLGYYTG